MKETAEYRACDSCIDGWLLGHGAYVRFMSSKGIEVTIKKSGDICMNCNYESLEKLRQ